MDHFDAITLKQLRALAAVVTHGSVTAAAQALHVTPPAISTQIRTLEANVGAQMFVRAADGRMTTTPEGRELLAAARRIEIAIEHGKRRLRALASGRTGLATLGVVSTGKYFAPRIVALARTELPGIEIVLKIGNREETIAALTDGSIDLAVMGRPPRVPLADAEPIGAHPHVLIAAPGHPLAGRHAAMPLAIFEETFLVRESGSGTRLLTERFLDQLGEGRTYASVEFGSNETIKQGVMAGLGIALISGHTVVAELESSRLALIEAPGLPIMRQWFVVRPRGVEGPEAVETLTRFLVEQKDRFLPRLD